MHDGGRRRALGAQVENLALPGYADMMRDPQYKGTVGEADRGTLLEAGGPPHR